MDQLVAYPWQGNIRELQNIVERAVVLAQGSMLTIDPEVLGMPQSVAPPTAHALSAAAASEDYGWPARKWIPLIGR